MELVEGEDRGRQPNNNHNNDLLAKDAADATVASLRQRLELVIYALIFVFIVLVVCLGILFHDFSIRSKSAKNTALVCNEQDIFMRGMYAWQNGDEAQFKKLAASDIFFQIPRLSVLNSPAATGISGLDQVWAFRQGVPGFHIGNGGLTWLNTFDSFAVYTVGPAAGFIPTELRCQMKIFRYDTGSLFQAGVWTIGFNDDCQIKSMSQHVEYAEYLNNTEYIDVRRCEGRIPCPTSSKPFG